MALSQFPKIQTPIQFLSPKKLKFDVFSFLFQNLLHEVLMKLYQLEEFNLSFYGQDLTLNQDLLQAFS